MATGTRPDGIVDRETLPSNMRVFTVMGGTIMDSLGEYCEDGQEAALTEKQAKHYYGGKNVQAAMPLFDELENTDDTPTADDPEVAAAVVPNRRQARA